MPVEIENARAYCLDCSHKPIAEGSVTLRVTDILRRKELNFGLTIASVDGELVERCNRHHDVLKRLDDYKVSHNEFYLVEVGDNEEERVLGSMIATSLSTPRILRIGTDELRKSLLADYEKFPPDERDGVLTAETLTALQKISSLNKD